MSDLNRLEKRALEKALKMSGGYVLNFSNRTFDEFIFDCVGIEVYEEKYAVNGESKANRMRTLWDLEPNHIVATVLENIYKEWEEIKNWDDPPTPPDSIQKIIQRLKLSTPIQNADILTPNSNEKSFELIAKSIQDIIDKNQPEQGLDRLHTFTTKFFRELCKTHNIEVDQKKPLHSIVGGYVKKIKEKGFIESEMTEKILRSSISIMDSFNYVRNNQSLAHDNTVLQYSEAVLIFNHVTSSIRFIRELEESKSLKKTSTVPEDDLPF